MKMFSPTAYTLHKQRCVTVQNRGRFPDSYTILDCNPGIFYKVRHLYKLCESVKYPLALHVNTMMKNVLGIPRAEAHTSLTTFRFLSWAKY